MSSEILLSICIPTYNRAELLAQALGEVLEASREFAGEVEVVVSDNASTDNTRAVVEALLPQYPHLRYFRNEINEGANRNFLKLTDNYARGKYCWLLGDDDTIIRSAFAPLLGLLRSEDPDFVKLNSVMEPGGTRLSELHYSEKAAAEFPMQSFVEAVDAHVSGWNMLDTFISAAIFRLEPFRSFPKSESYYENKWNLIEEVFPHTCVHVNVFSGSERCICFSNVAVVAYFWQKDWDDKLTRLHTKVLPELYYYFLRHGNDKSALRATLRRLCTDCIVNLRRERNAKRFLYGCWFTLRNLPTVISLIFKKLTKS